jgi:hypothetical protein
MTGGCAILLCKIQGDSKVSINGTASMNENVLGLDVFMSNCLLMHES